MEKTICGECKRSAGRCSWSAKFVPVEGWTAIPSKVVGKHGYTDTYIVTSCPKFEENVRYNPTYKFTFRKGSEEKVCIGKEETEAFIGTYESEVRRAVRHGRKIKGYDVEMCLFW